MRRLRPHARVYKFVARRRQSANRGKRCGSSGSTPRRDNLPTKPSSSGETKSEIRNPDGSTVFSQNGIEVPAAWSQVACDVLAQKYFRKAGVPARLKRVEENSVPSFLWRSVPDEDGLAPPARKGASRRRDLGQAGVRPARRRLDLLGLEGRLFRHRGRRPDLFRRNALHAGAPDRRAQFAAMVQHRPALGLWRRRPRPGPFLRRFRNGRAHGVEFRL